jgi:hypothetical protein
MWYLFQLSIVQCQSLKNWAVWNERVGLIYFCSKDLHSNVVRKPSQAINNILVELEAKVLQIYYT